MEQEHLITCYFSLGFTNNEILVLLAQKHGIVISIRTLKRRMKLLKLFRRKEKSDIIDVALYITKQCRETGRDHGYRWMHRKCISEGFVVSQHIVRCLLLIIDPLGVSNRRKRRLRRRQYESPGPNYVWHVDG